MSGKEKYKNMTFGFYISGQDDQKTTINTSQYFEKACEHYEQVILSQQEPWVEDLGDGREIKLSPITKDLKTGVFNGVISRKRTETLPYVGSKLDHRERKIDLKDTEDVWERCYFSYFPDDDVLVFQEKIIGPKISDLGYVLFKRCAELESGFTFEAIWKSSAVSQFLNGKSTFKKVELSIALPRNFNANAFSIDDPWTTQIINMMTGVGTSKFNVELFGRASQKRGALSYIKEDVGVSIKKMMSVFGGDNSSPVLKKAKVLPSEGGSQELNIFEEKLREKIRLACYNGYESEDDVFNKIILAKASKKDELKLYRPEG